MHSCGSTLSPNFTSLPHFYDFVSFFWVFTLWTNRVQRSFYWLYSRQSAVHFILKCTVQWSEQYTVQYSVLYSDVTVQYTERVTPRGIWEISQFHAIVPPRLYSKLVDAGILCHVSRIRREAVWSWCCYFFSFLCGALRCQLIKTMSGAN